jgi:hypothetical protein
MKLIWPRAGASGRCDFEYQGVEFRYSIPHSPSRESNLTPPLVGLRINVTNIDIWGVVL